MNLDQLLPYAPLFVPLLVAILALFGVVLSQRLCYGFSAALERQKARARAVPDTSAGLSRVERVFTAWLGPFAGYSAQKRRAALYGALGELEVLHEREKFSLDEGTNAYVRSVLAGFRNYYSEVEMTRAVQSIPAHLRVLIEAVDWLEGYQLQLRPQLERRFFVLTSSSGRSAASELRALPSPPRDLEPHG